MSLFRPLAILVFACLQISAFAASGPEPATQSPAVQSTPASGPASVPATAPTVLRSNAELVLVDVVVTDRNKAIHGLERQKFHIFEDGREQPIASFDEHRPPAAPAAATSAAALPPYTYTNIPAYPEASAVNVLLLDGLNTPVTDQAEVRRQMLQYMSNIQPGTSLAIFTLASLLRMAEGFTTDIAQLTKDLQSNKGGPHPSAVLDPDPNNNIGTVADDAANVSVSSYSAASWQQFVTSWQQFAADVAAYRTDQRVQMTLYAMQQLARYLSAVPGRKNLIWFSGSFPIWLAPDDSLSRPFEGMRSYTEDIQETAELLSASRVAVYPVDARGLMNQPAFNASYSSSGKRAARDNRRFINRTDDEHATMDQIAEQTGGQAYVNTNGLKEAVASAVENGSSYYTIGYVPAAKKLDGQFHKLQLSLDNTSYKLAYRRGYYADPTDKPSDHNPGKTSMIIAATMHGAPPATQIQFQTRVLPATDPLLQGVDLDKGPAGIMAADLKQPVHRYVVDLNMDAHGLTFDEMPDGVHHAQVEFVLVAYDTDGKRVNYLDRSCTIKIKPEKFARTMAHGIPMRLELDLPTGQGSLRIAVNDPTAGRTGSLEVPLAVAAR